MIDENQHKCIPIEPYCICSSSALEPDDYCPIHGGCAVKKRCKICGRYLNEEEK